MLEEQWRVLEGLAETDYLREATQFFETLLSGDSDFWGELPDEVLRRFILPGAAEQQKFPVGATLKAELPLPLLIFRVAQLAGLNWRTDFLLQTAQIYRSSHGGHEEEHAFQALCKLIASNTFPSSSLRSIFPRTKYLHRVSFEEGTALCRLALTRTGPEARRLLNAACSDFAECLRTKPDDYRALYNWGFSLSQQAAIAEPADAPALWREMGEKFVRSRSADPVASPAYLRRQSRALILKPTDWRALGKWGTALQVQSRRLKGDQAVAVLEASSSKLNQAVALLSYPHFKTIFNAGNADLYLARSLEHSPNGEQTLFRVLNRSIGHFSKSCLLEPNHVDALRNYAARLVTPPEYNNSNPDAQAATAMLARVCTDPVQKEALYSKTFSLYSRAVGLAPSNAEVRYSCGNAYFRRALALHDSQSVESAHSALLESANMYCAALRCLQTFRDAFVNLAITIALSSKWRVLNFETAWLDCVHLYLDSCERFASTRASRDTERENSLTFCSLRQGIVKCSRGD